MLTPVRSDLMELAPILIPVGVVLGAAILSSLRVLYEYERGVVFRLGKLTRSKGPGLIFLVPFGVERMRKMDLRIVALDITPQDTITKDNVSVKVNAVVYFRVADPSRAVVEIEDYYYATSQLAQTTLRSVIGQSELDELLAERDKINAHVCEIIDEGTDPWGIEVTSVEVKDIDLPHEMKRAMAKQAESERERRGKVIAAEGELQASRQLSEAAKVMSENPASLQLRYLQTAVEIAAENNSTTVFPIPMELFPAFTDAATKAAASLAGSTDGVAPLALPDAASPQALAEASETVLGIGSGRDGEDEKAAVPAGADGTAEESEAD
jgi:regulator of protease activity HflC (stomatin/prohibitin superfamily)